MPFFSKSCNSTEMTPKWLPDASQMGTTTPQNASKLVFLGVSWPPRSQTKPPRPQKLSQQAPKHKKNDPNKFPKQHKSAPKSFQNTNNPSRPAPETQQNFLKQNKYEPGNFPEEKTRAQHVSKNASKIEANTSSDNKKKDPTAAQWQRKASLQDLDKQPISSQGAGGKGEAFRFTPNLFWKQSTRTSGGSFQTQESFATTATNTSPTNRPRNKQKYYPDSRTFLMLGTEPEQNLLPTVFCSI